MQETAEFYASRSRTKRLQAAERVRAVYTAQLSDDTPDAVYVVEHLDTRLNHGEWIRTWQPYFVAPGMPKIREDALAFLHEKAMYTRKTDALERHPPEVIRLYALFNLKTRERTIV